MNKNKLIALVLLIASYVVMTILLAVVFPGNHQLWRLFEVLAVLAASAFYLQGAAVAVVAAIVIGTLFTDLTADSLINYLLIAFVAGLVGWYSSRKHAQEEHLGRMLMIDRLTGLRNYSYFIDRLEEERRRADRFGSRVSLIMIDIDHFKPFNDEYGHLKGNELLKKMASVFKSEVREIDIVCRYGGEEFAVLLPNTGHLAAEEIAERIRTAVEDIDLPENEKRTISAGVASYPRHAEDDLKLIDRADEALYQAKEAGRNRVIVFGPKEPDEKKAASK